MLHDGAVAFGGIYPRQKQGHQQCPYEGDACRPVGYGLPPAYVFAGDGDEPHGGEQQGDDDGHGVNVAGVVRAEIGGAFGEFGGDAVVHGDKAYP